LQQYPYEALGVAFVLLFAVTWLLGRRANQRLANKWLRCGGVFGCRRCGRAHALCLLLLLLLLLSG
jgi:hypothetical protein